MPNTLYYGDNLDILRRKVRDETVDLCYIDPPFNSKRNYFQIYNNIGKDDQAQAQAFVDTWTWNEWAMAGFQEIITNFEGRYTRQTIELMKGLKAVLGDNGLLAYLISMAQRANEIQRVLKPTGSFYLHCDPTCSHYLKLILDGIFCGRGGDFRGEIIWKRKSGRGEADKKSKEFGQQHDVILFYSKTNDNKFSALYNMDAAQDYIDKRFKYLDGDGRRYRKSPLTSPSYRANLRYEYKGYQPPEKGWAVSREVMEQMEQSGRLIFPDDKTKRIERKAYLDEYKGQPVQSIWSDIHFINPMASERLGYPTQKPEALLERIIQASSHEGDTVLDAYCGCGTTVAVAQRLRRNWIGIDITYQSIAVILKRLEDQFGAEVLVSVTLDGIPRDMESARALAHKKDDRVRKEFEKWAVLTYSKNRATLHEKKGADKGVDGIAYFVTGHDTTERVIFQVKSGGVSSRDIRDLRGVLEREQAALAVFITLEDSTKPMRDEALAAGVYRHELLNRDVPRIQIVTVQEIIEDGRRIDLPLSVEVLKSATVVSTEEQQALEL